MSETWVLHNSLTDTTSGMGFYVFANFTSNNTAFKSIMLLLLTDEEGIQLNYGGSAVYNSITGSGWTNQAYRTITFDSPVTDTTLLSWLQVNGTKQSASSPTFKHFFNSGTIGSGTIKFRHFSQIPQLATPQNVAVNGTTLSWDAVENATSYDIYADGTLIGNTD